MKFRTRANRQAEPATREADNGRPWLDMRPADFDPEAPSVQEALFPEPDTCGTPDLFA